jgi:hypothetical protein
MPFEVANSQIKVTKEEILAELQYSLQHNNVLAIFVKDTHELLTTAVTQIEEKEAEGDIVIRLMEQDLHGYPVERNLLYLSNIDKVIHFNIPFNDPQYVKVRRKEKFKV